MGYLFADLKESYPPLFNGMQVRSNRVAAADHIVDEIADRETVYRAVMDTVGVPWQVVGVIHSLEGGLRMDRHLHNGDPLTRRTTHVPAGRPEAGNPPFTFAESAVDALKLHGLQNVDEWTMERTLYELERYNGFGYRPRNINTPYLWSFSDRYAAGKFTQDKVFSPTAVSGQCGGAVLLNRMIERGIFSFDNTVIPITVQLGAKTVSGILYHKHVWVPVRDTVNALPGVTVDAVRMTPTFVVSVSAPCTPGPSRSHRDFAAMLYGNRGHVQARELLGEFLGKTLEFKGEDRLLIVR